MFKDGTVYSGEFVNGKPIGAGTFTFMSGIVQKGSYVAVAPTEEESEESVPTVRATTWRGDSVLVC